MLKKLGIEIVKLDLPFRLNHVNCLLAEGENGWAIIDTGLHDTKTIARWEDVLQGKNVNDLYISHYHPDHFGYAGGLQQKTGAKVSMTQVDANTSYWSIIFDVWPIYASVYAVFIPMIILVVGLVKKSSGGKAGKERSLMK